MGWFKKKGNIVPRQSFAITTGKYAGEIWIFIEETASEYCFLSIPVMQNRQVPKETFMSGIQSKVVDEVSQIPKDVFAICKKQYYHTK